MLKTMMIMFVALLVSQSSFAEEKVCGLKNCHGLDFSCEFMKEQPICTMIFAPGDICRRYATCEVVGDVCQLSNNLQLKNCAKCVQACQHLAPVSRRSKKLKKRASPRESFDQCQARCVS